MRRLFGKIRVNVFVKIFIGFLALIVLIYAYSLLINGWGQNEVRREISESTMSKINYFLDGIEKDISSLLALQRKLGFDTDLYNLSMAAGTMTHYDVLMAVLRIQQKIIDLKNMNSYVENIEVYIPLIGKKIATDYIYDLQADEFDAAVKLTASGTGGIIVSGDNIYMNTLPWYYNPGEMDIGKTPFVISVALSRAGLEHALRIMSEKPLMGALLLGDAGSLNVYSQSEENTAAALQAFLDRNGDEAASGITNVSIDGKEYIVVYRQAKLLGTTFVAYTDEQELLAPLMRYRIWSWTLTIMIVAVVSLFVIWIRHVINSPMDKLIAAFDRLKKGDFNHELTFRRSDEFGFLYQHYNETLRRMKELIEQVYEQKILAQNAELKQLQYQISPHFLYNSIYNVYRIAKLGDMDKVLKLTWHLGGYYQYITRDQAADVLFEDEVRHAMNYVEVQKIRFSGWIAVDVDGIPAGYERVCVPKLILQPIIENAYVHGMRKNGNAGEIRVNIIGDGERLTVTVQDNGRGMDKDVLRTLRSALESGGPNAEHTGLLNVHRRLRIKYGERGGLRLSVGELGGLRVDIDIAAAREETNVSPADHR